MPNGPSAKPCNLAILEQRAGLLISLTAWKELDFLLGLMMTSPEPCH